MTVQSHPDASPDAVPLLSEKERHYVDEYTLNKRRDRERPGEALALNLRIRRAIEGVNRRAWYFGFSLLFHSKHVLERIPIQKLNSIFIIPIGDAIGDMVVALPLFHAIKRYNPSCRIGTLVSPRNRGLLLHDSSVDAQYLFRDKFDVLHYPQLFRARNDGYQVVINLHLPRMTEFGIISNIIGGRGIKVSCSHSRKDMYKQLYNTLLPYDRDSMHLSQLGLMMLESVIDFGQPFQQWESHPTLQIDEEQRGNVKKSIQGELNRLGADWFVHFNPQARNPTREWGFDNAFAFAQRFVEQYPRGALFFTASPVHRAEVEKRIVELKLPRVIFFPTSYNLLELAAISAESELVITPDTSVIHFGTASGKPTLVLWPDPEFLPLEWIPLQVPSINLAPEVRGMLVPTISVESVWQAARKLLDKEWTSSATSYGLNPAADPLYQYANRDQPIESLIKVSSIPKIFPEGSRHSVPLATLAEELVTH